MVARRVLLLKHKETQLLGLTQVSARRQGWANSTIPLLDQEKTEINIDLDQKKIKKKSQCPSKQQDGGDHRLGCYIQQFHALSFL